MYMQRDSKKIIECVKELIKSYYGKEYESLIDDRLKSLVDIVFYNNHKVSRELYSIEEILKEYEIDKYNQEIIDNKIPFSKDLIKTGQQGMMLFEKDNELQTIIYFPNNTSKQYNYDCILIHELLHAIDEHIIENSNNTVVSQGGFEKTVLKGEKTLGREYEFFNEIINQRIAEDINKFAYDNGIFIVNSQEEKEQSITEYKSDQCEVIELFFNKYKSILLRSKINGNIDEFISYIGEKEFEEFNNWIVEFYNRFTTPDIRRDMKNSKEYLELIQKGIDIVNKMKDNKLEL